MKQARFYEAIEIFEESDFCLSFEFYICVFVIWDLAMLFACAIFPVVS